MNKKEKFLLNIIEDSVDISPDFSKIEDKLIIKKKENKNKSFMIKFNFAKTVIATILLVGIIVPITLIVEETINSSPGSLSTIETDTSSEENNESEMTSVSENETKPSIETETSVYISDDESTLVPGDTSASDLDVILINNALYGLIEISDPQQDIPSLDVLEKEQVIKIDNYDVYLSLSIAYNDETKTWYKLILRN